MTARNWLVRREAAGIGSQWHYLGLVMAMVTTYWFGDSTLGIIIAFAIIVNLLTAGIAGASLLLILERLILILHSQAASSLQLSPMLSASGRSSLAAYFYG